MSFQALYARTAGWEPGTAAPDLADRPALDRWAISDDKGNVAHVTVADLAQSNGVIMVIDQVLMP